MNFLDLAKNRYTTKKYNPSAEIPEEKINQLKEILRLSPSSIDSQPWKFVFVSDKDVKKKFAEASLFNQHKVEDASHLVIFTVLDDVRLFENRLEKNYPEGAVFYYKKMMKARPESEIKSWLTHQVYISLGFLLAACAASGIDSTPMEGIDIEAYKKLLPLEGYKPLFAVAIGIRDENDDNQPSITPKKRLNLDDVVLSI